MDLKILKNKGKLILKKREKMTEDVVNRYSDEEAQIQLNLLEDAFTKYNVAYDEKSAEANDEGFWRLVSVQRYIHHTYSFKHVYRQYTQDVLP